MVFHVLQNLTHMGGYQSEHLKDPKNNNNINNDNAIISQMGEFAQMGGGGGGFQAGFQYGIQAGIGKEPLKLF